ncbi:hypothetical protein HYALB_00010594 [Hymenoscyphus albidus]|uniref:Uncharacterized protein n=1 Tax=Hymenoscyphus albidus TaxID=595503 RepID=A0A9N9LZT1_9HELO|nr:hypothetical protein HYALB_00010594 [Hymenoscyphus albidus]
MLTQSLPPLFLLPAWSAQQLRLLAIRQLRASASASYHSRDAFPTCTHQRRNIYHEAEAVHVTRGTKQTEQAHGNDAKLEEEGLSPHGGADSSEANSSHIAKYGFHPRYRWAGVRRLIGRPGHYRILRGAPSPPSVKIKEEKIQAHLSDYDLRLLKAIKRLSDAQIMKILREDSRRPDVQFLEDHALSGTEIASPNLEDKLRKFGRNPVEPDQTKLSQPAMEPIPIEKEDFESDFESAWPVFTPIQESIATLPESTQHTLTVDSGVPGVDIETINPRLTTPTESQNPAPEWKISFKPGRQKTEGLFDEMFPEENNPQTHESSPESQLVKLPVFDWIDDFEKKTASNEDEERSVEETRLHKVAGTRTSQRDVAHQSVLILNCALHSLEESDFFRLSPKGEHIEGWTSGIIKVIPGRDNKTLEPLDYYFILFSNEYTARAYLDNMFRLKKLAETSTRHQMTLGAIALPPGFLKDGEDVQTIVKNFSLAPSHTKLSMRLLDKPYKPGMLRLLSDGGPAAIANSKSKAENMVLFYTDHGRVSSFDIMEAIYDDGRKRNLMWKLVVGSGEKEIITLQEDGASESDNHESANAARQPKRHVISFTDKHEARRFVREWHRRPFPASRMAKQSVNINEPAPIINAEILW